MDLIIQYLIEKGGGFGVLLAISLAWIVFREKNLLSQKSEDKKESDDKTTPQPDAKDIEIAKILYTLQELKAESEKAFSSVYSYNPMLEQIYNMEKTGGNKVEKVNSHITAVENKISEMDRKIKDLWDWHSVKDYDGIPIWYNKKSTENTISEIKDSIETLDRNFTNISKSICMDLDDRLQKVNSERIAELKQLLDAYNKTVKDLIVALEKIKFLLKSKEDGE